MKTLFDTLSSGAVTDPEPKAKPVDDKLRTDWNAYIAWLDKKGMKGHPDLDKNDLGGKMIDLYRKENPNTLVSRETVIPIQTEFSKYRDWSINELKNKRGLIKDPKTGKDRWVQPNENLDYYMRELSQIDGIPGQRTTSFAFPEKYLKTFMNGQMIDSSKVGFAKRNIN